jgi:hypothetical protein
MGHQYGELSHHPEVAFRSSSYHLQEGGTRASSYHLQEGGTRASSYHLQEGGTMGSSCHLQETGGRGSSFHLQETGSRGSGFHLQEAGSRGSSFHLQETGPRSSSYHLHQETGGSRRARDWEQETAHSNTVRSRSLRTSSGGAPSSGRWRSRTESEGLTGGSGGRSRDRISSSTALLHQQAAAQPADSAALSIADFFTDPRY